MTEQRTEDEEIRDMVRRLFAAEPPSFLTRFTDQDEPTTTPQTGDPQ